MEKTVYKTTLTLSIIEPGDYLKLGTSEEEYDKSFPTAEQAIEKAKQLFDKYQVSKTKDVYSVVSVWAAVWPVVINEQGSKQGPRIFNLYKDQKTPKQ